MDLFENAKKALGELESQVKGLDAVISQKKVELSEWEKKIDKERADCDQIMFEKDKLAEILGQCSVDVCPYKNEFEAIRERYYGDVESKSTKEKFHFFLCYRGDYYGKQKGRVIESHTEIIGKNGFCWWGKFFRKREMGGDYRRLEPFGESVSSDDGAGVALKIRAKVRERIAKGDPVFLYNYSPNPPDINLYVCHVIDFYYGKEEIPYQDEDDRRPPECAYVPEYYFHRHDGNCRSCKRIDPQKCQLKFQCNFWFKIDKIMKLEDAQDNFANLVNSFTQDSINFAIPILYPLLVTQRKQRCHFPELVQPIGCPSGYRLEIPTGERGHTKTEEVDKYFSDLNESCGQCFVKVELTGCGPVMSADGRIQKGGELNEILMYLPPDYRIDGCPSKYKISLHKKTNEEQKQKVEEMIKGFLK